VAQVWLMMLLRPGGAMNFVRINTRLCLLLWAALAASCRPAASDARPDHPAAPPPRMTAARIFEFGGPDVVRVTETDTPVAGPGQVLVEVHASSINPADRYMREGRSRRGPLTLPLTLGLDAAGVVVRTGAGVTGFTPGQRVYGKANPAAGGTGGYAEYAAIPAGAVGPMPRNVGFLEAGTLPTVGTTALQGVREHMKLQRGQKVLIHGGGGGVGSIAIQIAKHLGAYVATTATGDDLAFAKGLGADEVIDYKTQQFDEILSGYDAVFDTVGGDTFRRSEKVLRNGGILVTITHPPDPRVGQDRGIVVIEESVHTDTASLTELAALVEAGAVKPHVDQVFPLARVAEAFRAREQGGPGKIRGKIAISIRP
jgi:alcohol dehydrogenase